MGDEPPVIWGRRRGRRRWWWMVGLFVLVAAGTCRAIVAMNTSRDLATGDTAKSEPATENLPEIIEMAIEEMPEFSGTIYLTFDDGPGEHTANLLDVLKRYNVKATFFVTCRGDDMMILREFNEGHTVALHTCSHNYASVYARSETYFADLLAVQERVKRITGETVTLIRFPGGSSNTVSARYDGRTRLMSRLVSEVTARGFTYFDWNVDSKDAGGAKTADEVYNNIASTLKVGGESLVLQHDVKLYSVEAVERVIQYGLSHGYKFEKLTDASPTMHHGVNN